MSKLGALWRDETEGLHPRLLLAQVLLAPLPTYVGGRLRAALLRLAGVRVGPGTVIWGTPAITGQGNLCRRLRIGSYCWINVGCAFDLGDAVDIGDRVSIGHELLVLTTTHALGTPDRRSGPVTTRPVRIESGAWIGSRCTILPGVTVGAGAVVAAGAVVTQNVPANTLVGGVPARAIRELPQ